MLSKKTPGSSVSMRPFEDPSSLSEESFEILESRDYAIHRISSESETEGGSNDEHLKQDVGSTAEEKSRWQYVDGVRGIELVDSRCYRTPHGLQKEATFPYASFEASPSDGADSVEATDYRCSLCGKVFSSKALVEEHTMDARCCSIRDLQCVTCGAAFSSKVSLALHMRLHAGLRPFRCTICTKTFCRSSTLALHMKMHVTGHRHFCQICGRWFKSGAALADHENSCLSALNGDFMNVNRPFRWQCSYCDKMFHHRRDKNIHERVHTGEKPYTCGYCGRGFTQSQTLTIHIRTHTGEKPYPCSVCGQEFRDSSALRKHEYRHTTLPSSSSVSSIYGDSTVELDADEDERFGM